MERKNKKTKSVGNGEGSLYYSEALKCWVFQYVFNGSRKTLKQRKSEKVKDFKARVTKVKNDINTNNFIKNTDISLYQILSDYIENKHNSGISQDRSYKRDTETLKLLVKCCQNFIYKPIQKVSTRDITSSLPNFIELETINPKTNKKLFKIYSQNVIDKLFRFLNKGFKIAISERIIQYNIMENETIKKPKSKKETIKVEALTVDEQRKLINILNNTNHKYKNIILLLLYTGLRVGELLALSKNNIDLTKNTIFIERTLTRDKEDKVILGETTKTITGKRNIYINNNAKIILKDILKNNITNMYNLVFFDYENNTFITPCEINSYLQRLNQSSNICKHIHTHMLRHTYATRCIEAGMSAKVLQKNLGHKKIQTTLDTYTSIFDKFNEDENKKYDLYMQKLNI